MDARPHGSTRKSGAFLRVVAAALTVATSTIGNRSATALAQAEGALPEPGASREVGAPPKPSALPEAPFGLRWLASKEAVAAMGSRLNTRISTDFGDSYVVSQLPRDLADLHYAVLSFGHDDQLIRITAIGTGFVSDHDGRRVKARYDELKQLLGKKYGGGESVHHTDKNFDGDRFGLGLLAKKNWMYTQFALTDVRIELSVFAEAGKTHWCIIFEYVPGMDRLQRQRKNTEEEVL